MIDWTDWPSDPYWLDNSGYWDTRPPWIRPRRPGTIRWALQLTTPPTDEPVSLSLAKSHMRIDIDDEDEYIQHLIGVAREYVEATSGMALMPQTWTLWLDRFPHPDRMEYWPWASQALGAILLPRPPVRSVVSVTWHGSDGSSNVVDPAAYQVDLVHQPPRIVPAAPRASWPSTSALVNLDGVSVVFQAGAASAQGVPKMAIQAMLLMLAHWHENREEVLVDLRVKAIQVPKAAEDLIGILSPVLVG